MSPVSKSSADSSFDNSLNGSFDGPFESDTHVLTTREIETTNLKEHECVLYFDGQNRRFTNIELDHLSQPILPHSDDDYNKTCVRDLDAQMKRVKEKIGGYLPTPMLI